MDGTVNGTVGVTCRCGKVVAKEDAVLGCFCSEDCMCEAAETFESQ